MPRVAEAQSVAPTRDELTRDRPAEAPRRPTLNVIGGIERSPCPLADPRYADVRVTLTEVRFNNLKGATPEELRPSWAAYANTTQPVAVLCEVRDAAATILRGKGYLAAVQVPTQRIENGVVTMETLFARVVTVRARGPDRRGRGQARGLSVQADRGRHLRPQPRRALSAAGARPARV